MCRSWLLGARRQISETKEEQKWGGDVHVASHFYGIEAFVRKPRLGFNIVVASDEDS